MLVYVVIYVVVIYVVWYMLFGICCYLCCFTLLVCLPYYNLYFIVCYNLLTCYLCFVCMYTSCYFHLGPTYLANHARVLSAALRHKQRTQSDRDLWFGIVQRSDRIARHLAQGGAGLLGLDKHLDDPHEGNLDNAVGRVTYLHRETLRGFAGGPICQVPNLKERFHGDARTKPARQCQERLRSEGFDDFLHDHWHHVTLKSQNSHQMYRRVVNLFLVEREHRICRETCRCPKPALRNGPAACQFCCVKSMDCLIHNRFTTITYDNNTNTNKQSTQ